MKRLFGLALLVAVGCAGEDADGYRRYANSDEQLAVGNGALMTCTCLWVMDMPEDYCRAWVKASPDVARLGIDQEHKTVESSAFVAWSATAHYVDARVGCILE